VNHQIIHRVFVFVRVVVRSDDGFIIVVRSDILKDYCTGLNNIRFGELVIHDEDIFFLLFSSSVSFFFVCWDQCSSCLFFYVWFVQEIIILINDTKIHHWFVPRQIYITWCHIFTGQKNNTMLSTYAITGFLRPGESDQTKRRYSTSTVSHCRGG
jgi:hypothetical protein